MGSLCHVSVVEGHRATKKHKKYLKLHHEAIKNGVKLLKPIKE